MKQLFSLIVIIILVSATIWAILHIKSQHRLTKALARLMLIMGVSLLLIGGGG